ncbi:MAG TPA: glycosyltransferase family 2 protein, partial [Thermoanaerobaculia bacterium]|nr:glycosyltransferase family 2 protein [Thermoanaerobaculia bacterium]
MSLPTIWLRWRRRAGRGARALLGQRYGGALRALLTARNALRGPIEDLREFLIRWRLDHVRGPRRIETRSNELIVACVVRDGAPWLEAFLAHYRRLGAAHFVFVDNDSSDRTAEILSRPADDVTVFRTAAPFRRWQYAIRRWIAHRFAGDGWVLIADIDELFDYPRSSELSLTAFLGYLNEYRYSGVAIQMLELFSPESPRDCPGAGLVQCCRFYDLSSIAWEPLTELPALK